MFEDEIDLEGFYGQPSSSALGVLVQILTANKTIVTLDHINDAFSDHIDALLLSIDELRFLGLLYVAEIHFYGSDTLQLIITGPGHAYLELFASKLISQYKFFRE